MNLNQLRVFSTVASAGSLTAAARLLGVSQPAVSRQLADLEQDLGTPLFDRLPRGVRPTAAGQLLQAHAQRILASEAAAESELAELTGLSRGRLSVGASTTIGAYLLPPVLGAFNRAHPRVRLELEIGNTAQIQSAVLDNRIDLGVTEGFVTSEALEVEVVGHDDIVAIAAPSHAATRHPSLQPADLKRWPFMLREHGSGTRDVVEAALGRRGVAIEPLMSLGSTEAIKNAVAAGLGIAMLSRLAVVLDLQAGRLAELSIEGLTIRRSLHLVRLKGKHPSPAVAAFLDLLHTRDQLAPGRRGNAYAI